jgi:hypothetical protein
MARATGTVTPLVKPGKIGLGICFSSEGGESSGLVIQKNNDGKTG